MNESLYFIVGAITGGIIGLVIGAAIVAASIEPTEIEFIRDESGRIVGVRYVYPEEQD